MLNSFAAVAPPAPSSSTDPAGVLAQYGAIGMLLAVMIGVVVWMAKKFFSQNEEQSKQLSEERGRFDQRVSDERDRLVAESAALKAELRESHRDQLEKVVPALLASAEMTREAMHLIRERNRGH